MFFLGFWFYYVFLNKKGQKFGFVFFQFFSINIIQSTNQTVPSLFIDFC